MGEEREQGRLRSRRPLLRAGIMTYWDRCPNLRGVESEPGTREQNDSGLWVEGDPNHRRTSPSTERGGGGEVLEDTHGSEGLVLCKPM